MIAPAGAGMPVKYAACHFGFSTSIIVLKRASRRPVASANTMATIQPKPRGRPPRPQMKTSTAGATPKLTKSARLSSSAPNLDWALQRARQPAVDAVEQGGDDDERDRHLVAQLDGHADGGQAGAQAEQREEVRHQHAHGDAAVAKQRAGARRRRSLVLQSRQQMDPWDVLALRFDRAATARVPRARAPSDLRSASTVSPPTARWPTATSAPWPGGR